MSLATVITVPGSRRRTPLHTFTASDPLWNAYGGAVHQAAEESGEALDRAEVIRRFMAWYARLPGAKLPKRPDR